MQFGIELESLRVFILFEVIESVIFAVKRHNELIHNFRAKKVDFDSP